MINKINYIFEMVKRIYQILLPEHRKRVIPVYVGMFLASILEMLGIAVIVPFINSIMNVDYFMNNRFISPILKRIGIDNGFDAILFVGIVLVLVYIAKNVFLLFIRSYQTSFSLRVCKDLSTEMLRAYMTRPYSYFLEHSTSEVMRGVNSDTASINDILIILFTLATETITMIAIGVFIFITDPIMTIGLAIIALLTMLAITIGFKKPMLETGKSVRESVTKTNRYLLEATSGIKEITVMQRRDMFVEKYEHARDKERHARLVEKVLNLAPERIIETFFFGGIIMIVVFRIRWGADVVTYIPKLASFAVASYRLLPSINKISTNLTQLAYYSPMLDATYVNFMEVREQVKRQQEYMHSLGVDTDEQQFQNLSFEKSIIIKDIIFRYNSGKNNVLKNLSMTIAKGESIGLMGQSGAGKSTLADCILGLLKPQNGTIKMDGYDILAMPKTWSRIIGYVPQTVYLIDDTVRANIAFGLPESEISDDKIWAALKQAQLDDFVRNLPNQLDTLVGERGVRFSGGQRQRISIARALYYNPQILVLDEATSALDNDTEEAIMEAIESLQGSHTLIIVAHRLSTLAKCDQIYEIKNGVAVLRKRDEIFS